MEIFGVYEIRFFHMHGNQLLGLMNNPDMKEDVYSFFFEPQSKNFGQNVVLAPWYSFCNGR